VRSTAEIGLFLLVSEGSSASNVRRIEALTGPEAVRRVRFHDRLLHEAADALRVHTETVPSAIEALQRQAREAAKGAPADAGVDVGSLVSRAGQVDGAVVLTEVVQAPDAKALLALADRAKGQLGERAAIVLGCAVDGRVHLVASVTPALVERGVKAGAIVREAAQVAGGGGGGRDTMAQAGGRDPEKLGEAIAVARAAIEAALAA
jgi:alanyl-tRNA synthetase